MWRPVMTCPRGPTRRALVVAAVVVLSGAFFQPYAAAGTPAADFDKNAGTTADEPVPYQMPAYQPKPRTRSAQPPARPAPEDYGDFVPGLRLLLEDVHVGRLSREEFVNHAYAKLGYQDGVPTRYGDATIPAEQRTILGMALGRELALLPQPVRKSMQNKIAHADLLAPLIARQQPPSVKAPPTECGQRGQLPGDFDCLHNTANFTIFYSLDRVNNVNSYDGAGDTAQGDVQDNGVPNYVERVSRSFEVAWAKYASLGYRPRNDEDNKVAVMLGSTATAPRTGFVQPYEVSDSNIVHIGTQYSTGREADEFYLPRHELFHSMQYRYLGLEFVFNLFGLNAWMEATAEWGAHQALVGDAAVPSGLRYSYANDLPTFFQRPEDELTQHDGFGDGRQYGAFIFAEFMEERLGVDSIRHTWERIGDAWFPDGATEVTDTIEDDYDRDVHEEFRAFGVANYQLCGTGSTSTWRYQDADVSQWCSKLGGTGVDGTFSIPRPAHQTVNLPANGVASGSWEVEGGGVHYVDLVGQADPSKLWNMAVRTMQDDDRRLTFTVVNWDTIPERCFVEDRTAREEDRTLDTRIGGDCHVVTLMFSHGLPDEGDEEGRWETRYTSQFGGGVGGTEVEIGVQPGGNLIIPGRKPSAGTSTTELGLRHKPTNLEAVSDIACHCEGWGVQVTPPDGSAQWSGWAHGVSGLSPNAEVVEFTTTPTTAKSVVRLAGLDYPMYVTHEYRPSARPELYDVTVTITSLAPPGDEPHMTYRRVVDWDVEPTPLQEYGTMKVDHPNVEFASDDGLAQPDPATGRPKLHNEGSFTDAGPFDQGALIDINVPVEVVPGDPDAGLVGEFHLYYGAAPNQTRALDALSAVGAPVYSLAKSSAPGNPATGEPATFILGYRPVT